MRADFLRGNRKEGDSNVKEKRKEDKLGLRGKRQRKGQLWARKEDEDTDEAAQDWERKKEMERNQVLADQEIPNKRSRVDPHYPWQAVRQLRRMNLSDHRNLGIFYPQSNPKWDRWNFYECLQGNGDFFSNYGNPNSRCGFPWTNISVPSASLRRPPLPTPSASAPPPPPPTPSSTSPPTHPASQFAEHPLQRLSVITSTSNVQVIF